MKTVETIHLPAASMGNQRHLKVIRYRRENAEKKAYLQTGLHANEPPGMLVLHHLIQLLDQADHENKIAHEIVLVPAANPVGLDQWRDDELQGRFNFYDGVNFNRQYPSLLSKVSERIKDQLTDEAPANVACIRQAFKACVDELPGSEEVQFLKKTLLSLACDSDLVLDIHCDNEALFHVYTGYEPDPRPLAEYLNADITLLEEATPEMAFDQACNQIWWNLAKAFPEYPIPPACQSATVELRGEKEVNHELASQDAHRLFNLLCHYNYIEGKASPPVNPEALIHPLNGVEYVASTIPGIIIFHKNVGEFVKTGEVVAEIFNPLADNVEESVEYLKASTDGLIYARVRDRFAKPGRFLTKISGKTPIKGDDENHLTL